MICLEEYKIEGRNPIIEAIKAGREIDKIMVQKSAGGSIGKILALAREKRIVIIEVERQKLDSISETGTHQGIIAFAAAARYAELDDILNKAKDKGEHPFIVITDDIEDPHNLGSIIRSANAAGAHGVIIPKRHGVGLTATVAKSSAGAIEHTLIARVSNIAMTIEKLKDVGLWIAGADMSGESTMYKTDLTGPIAVVIGSEGAGIGRLIKEKCDFLVKIPMLGQINSLNAAVAGALIMYEIVRQRISKS